MLDHHRGTLAMPQPDQRRDPTPVEELDDAVAALAVAAPGWASAGLERRIALLDQAIGDTLAAAEDWVVAAQVAKGISRDQRSAGEDWISGPYLTLRNLRLLRRSLQDLHTTGAPRLPAIEQREDGRTVVRVFPMDAFDRLALVGTVGEVVMREGITPADVRAGIGAGHRDGAGHPDENTGEVALVLGAGNVSSIAPMDALAQLVNHRRTVVLKMNPVNESLGPHLERALRAFVDADLLRIVYGGRDVGAHLVDHPDVAAVHVTGSDKTHDAIVFGPGEEGARRRANRQPRLDKPVTSELGNVTPVIVVPGPWSDDDLAFQGDNIASMLANNAGFNCNAARVVVTHRAWNRRAALLEAIRASLERAEPRVDYYPGARNRWEAFTAAHPQAIACSGTVDGSVPFTLIPDVAADDPDALALTTEAFCGIVAEVGLPAPRSVVEFLDWAVDFANETVWGTLCATIVVHPASLEDPEVAAAVERAIDRLEHGAVTVNHWAATAYGAVSLPWGGAPGQPTHDIQSGRGWVHNSHLLPEDMIEKSVMRGPWRPPLKPVYFHTNERHEEMGRLLAELEATRNPLLLARLAWANLRA